jgi:hypothetical protein
VTPPAAFIVFFVASVLLAVISGLTAALFKSPAMRVVGIAGTTFVTTLSLAMGAYTFLT